MADPVFQIVGKDDGGRPVRQPLYPTGLTDPSGNNVLLPGVAHIPRPTDVGALGAYKISVISGTIAAGAAAQSPFFSFRWAPATATQLALIKRVSVSMASLGTGFTAGIGLIELMAARGFTASDTGGTAIAPLATSNKLRTSFAASGVADLRMATTGALAAGTRTLDSNALAQAVFAVSTATNTVMLPTTDIFVADQGAADWPGVLANNEGFIVRATVPATGTWQLQVAVTWLEVASF